MTTHVTGPSSSAHSASRLRTPASTARSRLTATARRPSSSIVGDGVLRVVARGGVMDSDVPAVAGQRERDFTADAARGAGDERDLAEPCLAACDHGGAVYRRVLAALGTIAGWSLHARRCRRRKPRRPNTALACTPGSPRRSARPAAGSGSIGTWTWRCTRRASATTRPGHASSATRPPAATSSPRRRFRRCSPRLSPPRSSRPLRRCPRASSNSVPAPACSRAICWPRWPPAALRSSATRSSSCRRT